MRRVLFALVVAIAGFFSSPTVTQGVNEVLVCEPAFQQRDLAESAVFACVVSRDGKPVEGVIVQAELVASSRSPVIVAEPPDFSTVTDLQGTASVAYAVKEQGKDELCIWVDVNGKAEDINEGDASCLADLDTVRVEVSWTAGVPPATIAPAPSEPAQATKEPGQPTQEPAATVAPAPTAAPIVTIAPGGGGAATPGVTPKPGDGSPTGGGSIDPLVVLLLIGSVVVVGGLVLVGVILARRGRGEGGLIPKPQRDTGPPLATVDQSSIPVGTVVSQVPTATAIPTTGSPGSVPTDVPDPIVPIGDVPWASTPPLRTDQPSQPVYVPLDITPDVDEERRRQLRLCDFGRERWREILPSVRLGQPTPRGAFSVVEGRWLPAAEAIQGGRPPARLMGDYWHDTGFDVGEVDWFWKSDEERTTGVLESAPNPIREPYVTLLIGGGIRSDATTRGSVDALSAELWIREPGIPIPSVYVIREDPARTGGQVPSPTMEPAPPGMRLEDHGGLAAQVFDDGVYLRHEVAHPPNTDVMLRVNWDVSAFMGLDRDCRVRIVDEAQGGHITVADVRCAREEGEQPSHELWGVADLHSHPMNFLGFGKRLVAGGYPAGSQDVLDVGVCQAVHTDRGWDLKGFILNGMFQEEAHHDGAHDGAPTFGGWPQFCDGMHSQMHPQLIRRAFEGGLRLMVALAVHNEKLASEFPNVADQPLQSDYEATIEQIRFWKDVCRHNSPWMEIAETPADARRIIDTGKLAVILGAEVDRAAGLYATLEQLQERAAATFPGVAQIEAMRRRIRDDLRGLWAEGVRQLNPIHLTDNAFGGMAIYEETFNISNHFLSNGRYLQIVAADESDGIDYRINEEGWGITPGWSAEQSGRTSWVIDRQLGQPGPSSWYILPDYTRDTHGTPIPAGRGHKNAAGLTAAGVIAIDEMMKLGLLIDVDHMSQASTERTLELAAADPSLSPPQPYPLISSHASLRALSPRRNWADDDVPLSPGQRRAVHAWPSETEKTDAVIARLRAMGGMVAPITSHLISLNHNHGPVANSTPLVANDCAGSSKTWAQEFLRTRELSGGRFASFGTDMGLTLQIAPRFGPRAAYGLTNEWHLNTLEVSFSPYFDRAREERRQQAWQQDNGVRYAESTPLRPDGTTPYANDPVWRTTYVEAWRAIDAHARGRTVSPVLRGLAASPHTGRGSSVAEETLILLGLTAASASEALQYGTLPEAAYNARHGIAGTGTDHFDVSMALRQWGRMSGTNAPLLRSQTGRRDWNFNTDGLAHYGLLPDFFQDLRNVGLPGEAMNTLFRSAEDFIQVWERCFRTRRVHYPESTPVEYSYPTSARS